ncbi:hypothetical protein Thiowin_00210 [Thiorhodovibrio winogradskyi]|uniref:Uncharacterized protein n=1 Tax=Thiorhodovibrio winogradskyi TaxID=77007 RepID=A0ABZ0S3Y8_9GAMM|nr:hypothetical protein [Thiorhodovibrio winogradskyi]
MKTDTLLLRQINPNFAQGDRVTSQAFRPTPKDQHLLSVDDGDQITAAAAFDRFTTQTQGRSIGVMAVTCEECSALNLGVIADGVPYKEHVSIDFRGLANSKVESCGKKLAVQARQRGWLFQP